MRFSEAPNVPIVLKRDSAEPLHEQIVDQVRAAIDAEVLQPGDKLPSTRGFAAALGVSRSVTVEAFHALNINGLLETRQRSGTFVAARPKGTGSTPRSLRSTAAQHPALPSVSVDLTPGQACLSSLPVEAWRSAWRHASYQLDLRWETSSRGGLELRRAIARHLQQTRGIACSSQQIVVTRSVSHAVWLLSGLAAMRGNLAVTEEPCPPEFRQTLTDRGMKICPVAVDCDGVLPSALPDDAALALVSAAHQMPTGAVLSPARRSGLLRWAERSGALIIEDDTGYEFRASGLLMPAMFSMQSGADVAYVGSFNRLLGPAVQLGFIVARGDIPDLLEQALSATREHPQVLVESAVTQLLCRGEMARQIRRASRTHAAHRETIRSSLNDFPCPVEITGDRAGSHVVMHVEGDIDTADLTHRLRARGVVVPTMREYWSSPFGEQNALVIGYGHLSVARLNHALRLIVAETTRRISRSA